MFGPLYVQVNRNVSKMALALQYWQDEKEVIPLKPSRRSIKCAVKGRNPTIVEPQLLQQCYAHLCDHLLCQVLIRNVAVTCHITVLTVP